METRDLVIPVALPAQALRGDGEEPIGVANVVAIEVDKPFTREQYDFSSRFRGAASAMMIGGIVAFCTLNITYAPLFLLAASQLKKTPFVTAINNAESHNQPATISMLRHAASDNEAINSVKYSVSWSMTVFAATLTWMAISLVIGGILIAVYAVGGGWNANFLIAGIYFIAVFITTCVGLIMSLRAQQVAKKEKMWQMFPMINWNSREDLAKVVALSERSPHYLARPVLTPFSGSVILPSDFKVEVNNDAASRGGLQEIVGSPDFYAIPLSNDFKHTIGAGFKDFQREFEPKPYASTNASIDVEFDDGNGKVYVRPAFEPGHQGYFCERSRLKGNVILHLGGRWSAARATIAIRSCVLRLCCVESISAASGSTVLETSAIVNRTDVIVDGGGAVTVEKPGALDIIIPFDTAIPSDTPLSYTSPRSTAVTHQGHEMEASVKWMVAASVEWNPSKPASSSTGATLNTFQTAKAAEMKLVAAFPEGFSFQSIPPHIMSPTVVTSDIGCHDGSTVRASAILPARFVFFGCPLQLEILPPPGEEIVSDFTAAVYELSSVNANSFADAEMANNWSNALYKADPTAIPKVGVFPFVFKHNVAVAVGETPVMRAHFGPLEPPRLSPDDQRNNRVAGTLQHVSRLFTVRHLIGVSYTAKKGGKETNKFIVLTSPYIPFLPFHASP
mmetsp:Transcript_5515/g.12661  ORF Transcript_5515/g.12661 Transcript_5515/m.12661 type:complete len:677 (-) Transcript_5515:432-2462(-)|eukprot:CAMPEP_0113882070 /NCGR_PEP_ID=MMETSP0780_2-20120614/8735_1 /TAXON_ID=652834 /ORGANISM="Palpitomonas bilix" /LENGTH=676 /DNA_ID=CAMNT_0000869013 /DNA_START=20 /DNA_END=2050 /DNA_ORIENTATION=- /assembly_acc=CAM_ASM_000599